MTAPGCMGGVGDDETTRSPAWVALAGGWAWFRREPSSLQIRKAGAGCLLPGGRHLLMAEIARLTPGEGGCPTVSLAGRLAPSDPIAHPWVPSGSSWAEHCMTNILQNVGIAPVVTPRGRWGLASASFPGPKTPTCPPSVGSHSRRRAP
jgi:hypothetical protein